MSGSKRQDLPAGLWVVATPIGNLADLSERARAALATADAVLCEDTRRTARLVSAAAIQARLERFDAHSGPAQVRRFVERLEQGESLAVVTDAGTPGISDPAASLVSAARAAGVRVTPVPGPSAVTALLSVSGFAATEFAFRGFFPRKAGERRSEVELARDSGAARAFVWFESPERIADALLVLAETAPEAEVLAAKELTKIHERFFHGAAVAAAAKVRDELEREGAVGEWCFAALFPKKDSGASDGEEGEGSWRKALQCLIDCRVPASEAARRVSQVFGVAKNRAYEAALELSGKKTSPGG